MEELIGIREIAKIIKKNILMIIFVALLFALIAAGFSYFFLSPVYQSTTQILINQEPQDAPQLTNQSIQTDLELINTYHDILKSPAILDQVAERLQLDLSAEQLANAITVESTENSKVIRIFVNHEEPGTAVGIGNMIAEVFQEDIQALMSVDNVSILSPADLNNDSSPISTGPLVIIAIGLFLGALFGVGLAVLLHYLDTTLTTERDIKKALDIPVLGLISPLANKGEIKSATSNVSSQKEVEES